MRPDLQRSKENNNKCAQTEKIDIEKIPNVPRVPFLILKCSTRRVETMNIVLGTKYNIVY